MKIINGKNVYIQKRDYNLLFETPEEVGYYIDCTKDLDFVLVNDEAQKKYIKEKKNAVVARPVMPSARKKLFLW